MNPILPVRHFIPDVEARVWPDGRVYLYGSCDQAGREEYCSRQYRVFSSSDLRAWIDHGVSFRAEDAHSRPDFLYAPDCLRLGDRYYLFYCGDDGSEGVAVSESPFGPFRQARAIAGADGDGIDPAVLLDDDGRVYYFWGQHDLRGARLNADLTGIDAATRRTGILTEAEHGFHEGASIRKHRGIYYLLYTNISRGKATCLSYAVSRSPLGPYEKRGVVIDNDGCDAGTWNNHGSICEFGGQWFVFYHRSSRGGKYHRRVCVEPIRLHEGGHIDEVKMTTQGADQALDAMRTIEAYRACRLRGNVRTVPAPAGDRQGAEAEHLGGIHDGDWAEYRYLDFGPGVSYFYALAQGRAKKFSIEVRLDNADGPLVSWCRFEPPGTETRSEVTIPVSGVHSLWLVFRGPAVVFDRFWFSR